LLNETKQHKECFCSQTSRHSIGVSSMPIPVLTHLENFILKGHNKLIFYLICWG